VSISIAVCEDEAKIRNEIVNLIQSRDEGLVGSGASCSPMQPEYTVDAYESGIALLAADKRYDIYILDIQMPGMTGMELARAVRDKQDYPGPIIMFITALSEHMQEAFDVQAYHFLLKPLDEDKFHAVFSGAVSELSRRMSQEYVIVKNAGVTDTIPLGAILFVESRNKKIEISTGKETVEFYGKISEFEKKPHFFRCHRCYIVNMEHIIRYSANAIKLSNGQEIALSRKLYPDFVKAYLEFAMR
jgi:DNA-binding LytR/AlgR family response regulator